MEPYGYILPLNRQLGYVEYCFSVFQTFHFPQSQSIPITRKNKGTADIVALLLHVLVIIDSIKPITASILQQTIAQSNQLPHQFCSKLLHNQNNYHINSAANYYPIKPITASILQQTTTQSKQLPHQSILQQTITQSNQLLHQFCSKLLLNQINYRINSAKKLHAPPPMTEKSYSAPLISFAPVT